MPHFHHSKRSREWWSFSVFTPRAGCDAKHHSSSAHATINLTRNRFGDSGGKRVPHETAVSLIQQKGPVQNPGCSPDCDCRYCTFCSTVVFFFILLQSLKHIASRPAPLILFNQCNAACKAGKNRARTAFSPFEDNAARCSNVGEPGRILFAAVGSPLQSGRGSAKQSSVSINQSQRCSLLWKCWRRFSLSSYLLDWWCVLSPRPAVRCHYWLTTTLLKWTLIMEVKYF